MAPNNAMFSELSTSQKLDGTNYEIWHRKIQYLLDDKDLLEHLKVAKVPPFDKDRDGNKLILLLCSIRNRLRHTKTGPIKITRHVLLYCIAYMTISLGNLRCVYYEALYLAPKVDVVRDGLHSYYS